MKKNSPGVKKKLKRSLKYLKILRLKESMEVFFSKSPVLKYNLFRKQFFIYKMTKFGFLKRRIFTTEIAEMLFGFGDREYPLKKTVTGVENFIIKYLIDLISSITYISFWRVAKRPSVDDVLFLIRNNPRKLQRIDYLLQMKFLIEKVTGSGKESNSLQKKKFF